MSSASEREPRGTAGGQPQARAELATVAVGTVGNLSDLLSLRRVQLGGGLLAAVVLPALAQRLAAGARLGSFHPASPGFLLATGVAMAAGYVAMRQMRAHPGVRSFGYLFYAFSVAYGVLGVSVWLTHAPGENRLVFVSYALATIWFALVDRLTSAVTWRLAYVPGVAAAALPRAPGVEWRGLERLDEPLTGVTAVVVDMSANHAPEWERFLAHCALQGLPVYDLREVCERLTGKVRVQHLSENTLPAGLARTVYARVKRVGDILGVLVAVPVILPLVLAAAVLIRLESPGPALFRQSRMGHRGRPFTIYKLRSMHIDAAAGAQFTAENDPRVTRVGAFIRKYRIDELPQAWNILKGEMSWIGPRPEAAPLAEWYEREAPFYCYRHMIRPGITGWAQVHQGNVAGAEAAAEKLHYDFYYIKHLSAWLDLLIVAKTIQTVFTGFGSR